MKQPHSDDDTLADLTALLRIDDTALEEALQQQPDAFYRVSGELALQRSRRDALKQYVKDAEAAAYLDYRADHPKAPAGEINALVRMDTDVQQVVDKLLTQERRVARLEALLDAFKQRKAALKDLVELYLHNYYSDASGGRTDLREKQHMAVRARQQSMREDDDRRKGRR